MLHRRRDLTHLELGCAEWRLLEDVAEVLEPYKDVTTYLSSESYPTISVLGPLYVAIQDMLTPTNDDSAAVERFKRLLAVDMGTRYQDQAVSLCLNKASFLDPRFKTLAHLSQNQQEEVIKSIADELLIYISSREEHEEDVMVTKLTEISETEEDATEGALCKKPKLTLLEKLLGKQFDNV